MSTEMIEHTEMLLEQERQAPLKILTQHASQAVVNGLEKHPDMEIVAEVNLENAKEKAGQGVDFETVNFRMVSGSLKAAQESGADVVFFTNEKRDQLGICVRKSFQGHLQILTSHQVALLLSEILIEQYRGKGFDEGGKDPLLIRSIVLTDALEVQSAYKQLKNMQVYSGVEELQLAIEEQQAEYFILGAMDEANHVVFPGHSAEEGVEQGMNLLAEKALALKKQGRTLYDFLVDLYREYGFYHEKSFTISRDSREGEKYLKTMMDDIRKQGADILFGQPVRLINDFNKKTFYNLLTSKKGKTTLPKTNILQLIFADNTKITFVPAEDFSKISYHFSVTSRIPSKEALDEAKNLANEQIMQMMSKIGKI